MTREQPTSESKRLRLAVAEALFVTLAPSPHGVYHGLKRLAGFSEGILHPRGHLGEHLAGTPVYATESADDYGHNGGSKGLIDNFAAAFGDAFDSSLCRFE